jgi:hypothetical protein
MKHETTRTIAVATALAIVSATAAQASLIGDDVTVTGAGIAGGSTSFTAAAGIDLTVDDGTGFQDTYFVDVQDDAVTLSFDAGSNAGWFFDPAGSATEDSFDIIVSDLDWVGMPGVTIDSISVTIASPLEFALGGLSAVQSGPNAITFTVPNPLLGQGTIDCGTPDCGFITANITKTAPAPVPIPASVLLLGGAMAGLGMLRRRQPTRD